jgi:hypothetical protein
MQTSKQELSPEFVPTSFPPSRKRSQYSLTKEQETFKTASTFLPSLKLSSLTEPKGEERVQPEKKIKLGPKGKESHLIQYLKQS